MWGKRTQYFCRNVQGCDYARRDHVYWYSRADGNYQCSGCGEQLIAADTVNRTPLFLFGTALLLCALCYAGFQVFFHLKPSPIRGYTFHSKTTTVNESSEEVSIKVLREIGTRAAQIQYRTQDRTASAEEDYIAEEGVLDFAADVFEKTIKITILPDLLYNEGSEDFMIILPNTHNEEKHIVFIHEPPQNTEAISSAQTLVRNLSGIAMDIAEYRIRVKTISGLMQSGAIKDQALFLGYQKVRESNESNLRRARERYMEIFRELETLPHDAVAVAFDQWLSSLVRREYTQQHKATSIAQQQFQTFLSNGVIEMDLWVEALTEVIPEVDLLFEDQTELSI